MLNDKTDIYPIVIGQRVFTNYRIPVWYEIAKKMHMKVIVLADDQNPHYSETSKAGHISPLLQLISLKTFELFHSGDQLVILLPGFIKNIIQLKPYALIILDDMSVITFILAAIYARIHQTPLFFWSLGRIFSKSPSPWRKRIKPFHQWLLRHATGILCYSTVAKKFYIDEYNVPDNKCHVLYNCLHEGIIRSSYENNIPYRTKIRKSMGISDNEITFLYVGAMKTSKRPQVLVEACINLRRKRNPIHVILVGGGDHLQYLMKNYQQYPWIHFLGPCHEGVEKYFAAGDVYVQPGLGGLGLYQAMVCGMPVIAGDGDGTEYDMIENGKNGFLMRHKSSVKELTDLLDRFISQPDILISMGKRSGELVVNKFNVDNFVHRFQNAIHGNQPLE